MRVSNKEKYMAMVSRKEAANLISESNDFDLGEVCNDGFLD